MNKLAFLGLINPSLAYKCIMYAVNKCRSLGRRIFIMKKITHYKSILSIVRDAISVTNDILYIVEKACTIARSLNSHKEDNNNGK